MSWQGYTWSEKKMDSVPTEKNTQNYTCTSNCISCSASITPLVFQLPVLYPTLDPWPIMAHHGPWHLDEGPFRLQQIRQVKERRDGTPMLRPQLRLFRCQGCTVKLFGLAGCRGTFKTSRFHLAYTLILLTFTISMCIYIYVTYIDAFYLSLSVWDPEIDSASSSLFCSLRRAARLVTDWRVLGWVAPSCASVPSNALRKNLSASMLRRTTLGKRPGAEHHPTLGDGYIYIYIHVSV